MVQPDYKKNAKNLTYAQAFKIILEFFNDDKDKALAWYLTPNEHLDNISPYEMIKRGKGQKLMKFIRSQLCE